MTGQREPITIDHPPQSESSKRRSTYIKDSAGRIRNIAEKHLVSSLLDETTESKTALERAFQRERKVKEQQQKNIERIVQLAYQSCKDETAGDPDQDWLYRYFELAKEIHNTSMQKLWAQVLKREVTNPGTTSVKALHVLRDMTPKEAQILQRAASLSCSFGNEASKKLLIGLRATNGLFHFGKRDVMHTVSLGGFQLPYSSLLVLIELGLLHANELESGEIEREPPLSLIYQGTTYTLTPKSKGVRLLYYRFSPIGNELCTLLGNRGMSDYQEQMVALLSQKFTLTSDAPQSFHHEV